MAAFPPPFGGSTPFIVTGGTTGRGLADRDATVLDVKDFGAKCDLTRLTDVTTTASSAVISSASYTFTGTDVGKYITIAGAGAAAAVLNATISSASGGNATLSTTAGTSIAGTGAAVFGTDDQPAIQAAFNRGSTLGGAMVFLPGASVVASSILAKSNVGMFGLGAGRSILFWINTGSMTSAVIQGLSGSTSVPYNDCHFRDFEIDCSAATQATYNVAGKCFYVQFMVRPRFQNLYLHDSPASALGVDYLVEAVITGNTITGAGRLQDGTQLGGAGIGIAVGSGFAFESMTVSGNTVLDSATYGIFFEAQGTTNVTNAWAAVTNNIVRIKNASGSRGIGDCGLSYFECVGNTIVGQTSGIDGIVANKTTTNTGPGGVDGMIANNQIENCLNGIAISYNAVFPTATVCRYNILGNKIVSSRNFGINVQTDGTHVIDTLVIKDNYITKSTNAGILLLGAGGFKDVDIIGNSLSNNGQSPSLTRYATGISVAAAGTVARLRVMANSSYDNQGSPTQAYGLIVDTTTVTGAFISGNDFSNNVSGGINITGGGTVAGSIIGNKGYNPLGASSVTPGASPWTYTAGNTPETLYLRGGTVSGVVKNSQTLFTATPAQIDLMPGEATVITYSVAPTAFKDQH
jgi:hypothetical protein